jgi:hypothetical protein
MLARRILYLVLSACIAASGCDDKHDSICGNGKIEGNEQCDVNLGGATCRSLGHDRGLLACTNDCTYDESSCIDCGNGVAEEGEACDGSDLGGYVCEDLGYAGGYLTCTKDCTFNESGCLDCGGTDPCEGVNCSGHGACHLRGCVPWCECDAGYLPGYNLTCREEGSCKELGEECRFPLDCCFGSCLKTGSDTLGYCGMIGCVDDEHCRSLTPGGATTCCMKYYDVKACQAVAEGAACGDRSSACGSPCSGQFQSACAPGLACVAAGFDDPFAVCARPCSSDSDCIECTDPVHPDGEFSCRMTENGQRYCLIKPIECERNQDCPDGLVCGVRDNQDMTGLVGNCIRSGAQNTGEPCTFLGPVFSELPYAERCASEYCWFGYCSELCLTDADCPDDMYCTLLTGWGSSRAELLPFCLHMQGSGTPCSSNADCPAGETCAMGEMTLEDGFSKVCKTANCDPAGPDCLALGEPCNQGGDTPCWDGFCLTTFAGNEHCAAFCDSSPDCPRNMYCENLYFPAGNTTGFCNLLDGSGDDCSSDSDCTEIGEVCAYIYGYAAPEAMCAAPRGEGHIGDPCTNGCANGICISGIIDDFCSAPCLTDSDCPEHFMCHTIPDTTLGPNPACVPAPGSQSPCTGGQDCTLPGEMCDLFFPWEQPMEGRCVEGLQGGANPGELCNTFGDCFNKWCLSGPGYCTAFCFTNPDCAIYGMDCKYTTLGWFGAVPSCAIPDADSPLCVICDTDADCGVADARCIASQANPGEKYCGKPCAVAGDCPGGYSCVDVGGVNNCKPLTDTCIPD